MFTVITNKQTYRNLVYLLAAFPLGLFYFVFLTTALSLSLGLLVVGIGIPLLLLTMAFWWGFATFERALVQSCLGLALPADTWPLGHSSLIAGLKAFVTNPVTWKSLVYLILKFPFGLFSFVWLTVAGSFAFATTFAPVVYLLNVLPHGSWPHGWLMWVRLDGHFDPLGFLSLLVAAPLGIAFGIVALHLSNGIATVWGRFAQMMLSTAAYTTLPPTYGALPTTYGVAQPPYVPSAPMTESSPTAWIWQ